MMGFSRESREVPSPLGEKVARQGRMRGPSSYVEMKSPLTSSAL